ncbi:MAG: heavy metal translocating P-type ATPase [Alphaproteobacteria bacterium]|nr:heavy metal translocating P-type ATPase [Alphaproteobacteria bacterium]
MDCPVCADKVRRAVEALPGVDDVDVSAISGTLSMTLDPARTAPTEVEARVRALGYAIDRAAAPGAAAGGDAPRRPPAPSWYATAKGRLALATGALLATAWAVRLLAGAEAGAWAFAVACVVGAAPLARRAWAAARTGQPFTIEALMTVAAGGALVIGAAEEAAVVVFLFTVGEVLEGVAAGRARSGIHALADLVPRTALVESAGELRSVPAAALAVGQIALVRPGERVPADGAVVDGVSEVDESPVTGESVPVAKAPGDGVFAGSINRAAVLRLRVTRPATDNTIARIVRLVEEAESARAPTQRFIDRFARIYMPAMVSVALLVAVVPPLAVGAEWQTWIYRALALLLIGCPCALVISVPAAVASALSTGARHGLLFKGGAVVEAAAATAVVAFDKTGTLTAGRPEVTDVVPLGVERATLLAVAAGVETGSSHALAEAVAAAARDAGVAPRPATGARVLPGRGVEAHLDGRRVRVASPALAAETGVLDEAARVVVDALEAAGKTVAVVFDDAAALGLLALRDRPRADAADGLARLRRLGVEAVMLTGDNARTAAAVAGELGVEPRAGLLPEDKVAAVRALARTAPVMMVGDGINDAPALAAAPVGVAMGAGTDVALETAGAALMRDRVGDVAATIRLARATMANVRQNVAIALGLKGVFLVTTVTGVTGLWIAILADTGATVLVTLNALRLLGFRPDGDVPTAARPDDRRGRAPVPPVPAVATDGDRARRPTVTAWTTDPTSPPRHGTGARSRTPADG